MADLFGKFYMDILKKKFSPLYLVRDDGRIDVENPKIYFSEFRDWPDVEKKLMKFVGGKVLDVGAGAGRHALYLQSRGHKVIAIDVSPGAVKVMKRRGVKDARVMDFWKARFPKNSFDTVLVMFNNLALGASYSGMEKMLKMFHRIAKPGGRLVGNLFDPVGTKDPVHLRYHEINKKRGKPIGWIRVRFDYKGKKSKWFVLLLLTHRQFVSIAEKSGWKIVKVIRSKNKINYGYVFEKVVR